MIPKPPIVEKDKVSLEIDLEKLFGKKIVDFDLRRIIAEDLISIIEERTSRGYGVTRSGNEVKLKKYSKEYVASDEFKAFGKSADQVNMKLTGSMLASIDLISSRADKIEIGITDETEAAKAYNHMTGDTVKPRPFFGLTSKDLSKIKAEYKKDVEASGGPITVADIFTAKDLARLANIVGNTKIGFEP